MKYTLLLISIFALSVNTAHAQIKDSLNLKSFSLKGKVNRLTERTFKATERFGSPLKVGLTKETEIDFNLKGRIIHKSVKTFSLKEIESTDSFKSVLVSNILDTFIYDEFGSTMQLRTNGNNDTIFERNFLCNSKGFVDLETMKDKSGTLIFKRTCESKKRGTLTLCEDTRYYKYQKKKTSYGYDVKGNILETETDDGIKTKFVYNSNDKCIKMSLAGLAEAIIAYNNYGFESTVKSQSFLDGLRRIITYDYKVDKVGNFTYRCEFMGSSYGKIVVTPTEITERNFDYY